MASASCSIPLSPICLLRKSSLSIVCNDRSVLLLSVRPRCSPAVSLRTTFAARTLARASSVPRRRTPAASRPPRRSFRGSSAACLPRTAQRCSPRERRVRSPASPGATCSRRGTQGTVPSSRRCSAVAEGPSCLCTHRSARIAGTATVRWTSPVRAGFSR